MSEPKKVRNALVKLPTDPRADRTDKQHVKHVQFQQAVGPNAITSARDDNFEVVLDVETHLVHCRDRNGDRTFVVPINQCLWLEFRA